MYREVENWPLPKVIYKNLMIHSCAIIDNSQYWRSTISDQPSRRRTPGPLTRRPYSLIDRSIALHPYLERCQSKNKNISIISTLLGKGRFLSLIAKFMSFGLAQSVRLLGVAVSTTRQTYLQRDVVLDVVKMACKSINQAVPAARFCRGP